MQKQGANTLVSAPISGRRPDRIADKKDVSNARAPGDVLCCRPCCHQDAHVSNRVTRQRNAHNPNDETKGGLG